MILKPSDPFLIFNHHHLQSEVSVWTMGDMSFLHSPSLPYHSHLSDACFAWKTSWITWSPSLKIIPQHASKILAMCISKIPPPERMFIWNRSAPKRSQRSTGKPTQVHTERNQFGYIQIYHSSHIFMEVNKNGCISNSSILSTHSHFPLSHDSGQLIIFHQPRFPWNSRGFPFLNATFFGVRSCEVVIIWPNDCERSKKSFPNSVVSTAIVGIPGAIACHTDGCFQQPVWPFERSKQTVEHCDHRNEGVWWNNVQLPRC